MRSSPSSWTPSTSRPRKATLSIRWRLFDPQGKEVSISDPTTQVSLGPWERKTLQLQHGGQVAAIVERRAAAAL